MTREGGGASKGARRARLAWPVVLYLAVACQGGNVAPVVAARDAATAAFRAQGSVYMRLSSEQALPELAEAPREGAERVWEPTEFSEEIIRLRAGDALRVALEVPAGARLRGGVQLSPDADLDVTVLEDNERPLASRQQWPAVRELDLDLQDRAGHFVVLQFEASGGDVALTEPTIFVPVVVSTDEPEARPNILIFLPDTLRADHIGLFDAAARTQTPALDELARGGTVFERTFAPANWTKPNVATVLTGLEPWQHMATTHTAVLPPGIRTLPQYLQEAGYFTGAFATNGYISSTFGFERGFMSWRGHGDGPVDAARISREVETWLRRRPLHRPFFLYVHTTDSHAPYRAPARDLRRLDPGPYRGVANFRRRPQLLNEVRSGALELTPRDVTRLEALYDASITNQDRAFARILQALRTLGLEENTVVVFVADHGEEFLDHHSVGHGATLWNELLHIPLVIRVPGVTGPAHTTIPVGSDGVTPTLLELAGVAMPPELEGLSLMPILKGRAGATPTYVIGGIRNAESLNTSRLKLVLREPRGTRRVELYDLEQDPHERTDIASTRPLTTHFLLRALSARRSHQPAIESSSTTVDPALEAQLRALGYVGSQRAN